jgi:hypothetical protein
MFDDLIEAVLGAAVILGAGALMLGVGLTLGLGLSALGFGNQAVSFLTLGGVAGSFIGGMLLIGRSEDWIRRAALQPGVSRGTAVLGDDGLRLTGLFLQRFVPYDRMRVIVPRPRTGHVEIVLVDDRIIRFRVADPAAFHRALQDRRSGLEERDRAQPLASFRGAHAGFRQWLSRARKALSGGYRHETSTPEELLRIAEDPRAEPEQRIGAALALSGTAEPLRIRVAEAAESVARPHLGEALVQAVNGEVDEAVLERALKS